MSWESDKSAGNQSDVPSRFNSEKTVGEILLAARERKGLALDDVSQETKIPRRMLEYLETDNFEAVPAKVYAKGFLRSYAAVLDLDIDYILNKYEVQTGQTHKSKGDLWEIETVVTEEKLASPGILKRFVLPAVVVVAAVIILVKVTGRNGVEREPSRTVTPVQEEPQREEPQQTGPAASLTEEIVEEPAVPDMLQLTIIENPADSCWFELLAISIEAGVVDTSTHMFLLLPGQMRAFEASEAFVFRKVGNPGSFDLELNGTMVELSGERGRVMRDITITKDDLR